MAGSLRLIATALLGLWTPLALAEGAAVAAAECAGCHALEAPGDATPPLSDRSVRGGPPLHYAGSKFRREWLTAWLQRPSRIRPAGDFPAAHTVRGDDGDRIDADALPAHPALDAERARQVTDYLMTLEAPEGLIDPEAYVPGTVARRMGMLDFRKFKGCNACHRDAPGEGGVSGPELYTAWQRLQSDFIFAFVKDPTAWEPHSLMPVPDMNDAAVAKLANYLKTIGEAAE